jgi:hypothetical protein
MKPPPFVELKRLPSPANFLYLQRFSGWYKYLSKTTDLAWPIERKLKQAQWGVFRVINQRLGNYND